MRGTERGCETTVDLDEHQPARARAQEPRESAAAGTDLDDGIIRFQAVKTGLLGELSLEVLEGLQGGETIVTGPFRALRSLNPGDRVRVEGQSRAVSGLLKTLGKPARAAEQIDHRQTHARQRTP